MERWNGNISIEISIELGGSPPPKRSVLYAQGSGEKAGRKRAEKKRLAAIISICLSIAVVITAIAGTIAYTMTNQLPQDEKQFSEKERKVLLQTFQTVTSEKNAAA